MWIERVHLENVLAFREASIGLSPGFNVVLSPNEGGKSSLFRSVVAGFFAHAGTQSKDILALARWGCGGRFRIEIDFHLGGASYRLVRDFGSKEHAIYRKDDARPFAKGKDADAFLEEHLTIPDENLFLRVCGVRHEELGLIGEKAPVIGEKIEELLGGGWGEVTPASIQRTLEEKRRDLVRGMDRPVHEENRGALKRFTDDLDRLERDAVRASDLARVREGLLRAIAEMDAELARVDADLEILKTKRQKASAFCELEKNETALREKADGLRRRLKRVEELRALKGDLTAGGARFDGPLASRRAASLDGTRNDLAREALLDAETAGAGGGTRAGSPVWRLVLASILILGGAAAAMFWIPLSLVLVIAGLALMVWHLATRGGGAAAAAAEKQGELEKLRRARAVWAGGRSLDESKALLAEYVSWLERVRDVEARIEEAAGTRANDVGAFVEELDAEYGAAAVALRALMESRVGLEPYRIDADGMLRLDREFAARGRERERLAVERADKDRGLAALERMDVNDVAERLACAKEGWERAERRVRVLDAILETLGEARREMSGALAGRLPPLAGRYLSLVTGGRYGTLFVDPLTMRVEIVPAAGDGEAAAGASGAPGRVEPDALSQGARDQIYLAVRLALVELMSGGEPQPLFLDDPFVHFDPERRARALDLVREFAARHQVILFTCDPRYRETPGRLIELPGRA